MPNIEKIDINPSKLDKFLDIFGYILLILYWMMVIIAFQKLPEEIPVHYNGAGEVDALGPKNSIFMLPAIATLQVLLMSALIKNPENLNFSNKENIEQQIINTTKTIRFLKVGILIVFIFIDYKTIIISLEGKNEGLGIWFLPFFLALIFIPVIINIYKSWKLKHQK